MAPARTDSRETILDALANLVEEVRVRDLSLRMDSLRSWSTTFLDAVIDESVDSVVRAVL